MKYRYSTTILTILSFVFGTINAFAQATLLPPGEVCFQASIPTSGGPPGGIITSLGPITGGSGYVANIYFNVPLTGGTGTGAVATIAVLPDIVVSVQLTSFGNGYTAGDVLSTPNSNLGGSGSGFSVPVFVVQGNTGTGMVGLLGTITGGSLYTNGTYGGVPLTGGNGSGATANITVSGNAVTSVNILNPGSQYVVGDVLSANAASIGGTGSGFSVQIASVAINSNLAGGTVGYYIPSTNTFKQTWRNAAQTMLNTNPVRLDANGCAIVYGSGIYRQILKDSLGNTVYDQLTASTNQNNPYWAGQASGTANAISVVDTSFAAVDGSIVNFIPLLTNTGATTLNPSGFGNITVVKDTSSGPVALTGGEIVVSGFGNVVSAVYSASQNNFHLLNSVIQSGATAQAFCGTVGLKMVNGASNSTITITARQATMATSTGAVVLRSNISTTLNITLGNATSTAGGMDGESPGTSAWVDVFLIDNGTTTNGLGSAAAVNGLNPALPIGYTYKCYLGAFRVNSGGNLIGEIIVGNQAQWVVGGANNAALPTIANGPSGSVSVPTWTPVGVGTTVPPTSTTIKAILLFSEAIGAGGSGACIVAPNNSYGPLGSPSNPPPLMQGYGISAGGTLTVDNNQYNNLVLESANLYYASNSSTCVLMIQGWVDAVNAN